MAVPNIQPKMTGKVPTKLLDFDRNNPRLIEDGIEDPSDAQIIKVLADGSDLSELVASIAINGYIDIEPLIVQRIGDRFRVLRAIADWPQSAFFKTLHWRKGPESQSRQSATRCKSSLNKVTAYAVSNPVQARDLSGSSTSTALTNGMR